MSNLFTKYHAHLLLTVWACPGAKYPKPTHHPETDEPLWPLLEEMGLIKAVGGWKWSTTESGDAWIFDRLLAAAPVPPAGGEVEVIKVQYRVSAGPQTGWSFWGEGSGDEFRDSYQVEVRELVDRAHVTRLQADMKGIDNSPNGVKLEVFEIVCKERDALKAEVDRLKISAHGFIDEIRARDIELTKARELLNTPHTDEWFEGVRLEAGHQIGRWGTEHDAGKAPADWFWLIGYLAQKAMTAQMAGNEEKARHHTISTGAAMLNWFRAIVGDSNAMRPGIDTHQSAPAAKGEGDE